jgi:anti-anti-sigma factor
MIGDKTGSRSAHSSRGTRLPIGVQLQETAMTSSTSSPLVVHCVGPTAIVQLHGDFGEFTVFELDSLIRQTLGRFDEMSEVHNVVIDLKHTDYCGSSALGLLASLEAKCRDRGGRMAVCHASPHLQEVIRVTKLDRLWPLCRSLDEALQFVQGGSVPVRYADETSRRSA